jgi:hypothetical protein
MVASSSVFINTTSLPCANLEDDLGAELDGAGDVHEHVNMVLRALHRVLGDYRPGGTDGVEAPLRTRNGDLLNPAAEPSAALFTSGNGRHPHARRARRRLGQPLGP